MILVRGLSFIVTIIAITGLPVLVSAATPTGYLDGVQADGIALGWALDPDMASQSIQVHFYIDGPAGQGTLIGASTANVPRADVNSVMNATGNHGFSFQIPAAYVGGSHQLYAYAIDSSGTGENPNLPNSPKTFTISAVNKPVVGYIDQVASDGTVSGWAFDPDAPSQSIGVHVYIDAPAGQGSPVAFSQAASARPDVNNTYAITGTHGFNIPIPQNLHDGKSHTMYVYGVDTTSGVINPQLQGSPRTVTLVPRVQSSIGNAVINANGITIKTSARVSGAIDSLMWNGKEFVDSADHGRQIQTAWAGGDFGECFNPTEAGSLRDGPGHYSTSQLLSLTTSVNSLTTVSHPAFWQTPGTYGENCNFDNNPADQWLGGPTINATDQTRGTLNKTITIGIPGLPSVIEYISRITFDAQELSKVQLKYIILENPAVYMPTEFKRIYRVDATGALVELGPNKPHFNKFILDPVILATEDGKYALGLYSDEIPRTGYTQGAQTGYTGYGIYNWVVAMGMDTRAPKFPTSGNFFSAGTYTYTSYLAVGTLEDVRAAIQKLATPKPTTTVVDSVTVPPTISPFIDTSNGAVTSSPGAELTRTTIDALRAQIQTLIAQIAALKRKVVAPTAPFASSASCPNLTRNLSRGSRGSDVISLQQVLIAQGLLSRDSATGFFGAMTEASVQRWQTQNSIVADGAANTTGYGVVGVRTRAAIAARCGTKSAVARSCPNYAPIFCSNGQHVQPGATDANGCQGVSMCVNDTVVQSCPVYNPCPSGYSTNTSIDSNGCAKNSCTPVSQNTGSLTVSHTYGSAPLTVMFSGSSGQSVVSEVAVWIDFGDGSVDDSIGPGSFSKTHTYASPGTYSAKLQWRTFGQASSNFPTNTIGTVTVTVGAQASSTPTIHVMNPNGGETLNAGSATTVQWDASNVPATVNVGNAQVSYKIGLKLINPSGNVVGYIPLGSDLFDGAVRSTRWDPASLSGGFSALNQLKVKASVIKQTNQCVSAATTNSSLADSQITCISEETVASDDSDSWFSVKGATVCDNTVSPMICTQS